MATIRFHARTRSDFETLKAELDRALEVAESKGVHHEWHGRSVRISAPGASGSIVFDAGEIAAQVRLRFPATLARERIVDQIRRALERVADGPVVVEG